MKKKVLIWEIIGFLTVCALSGVFHFIYDWSGKQAWIGFFCPVNESTWEHLKLLFFPILIFSAIEYIWIRKESKNFIAARVTGTVLGMFTIIAVFYTYTGILGNHYMWLDLVTFFIGALVTFLYTNYGMKRYRKNFYDDYGNCCVNFIFCGVCNFHVLSSAYRIVPRSDIHPNSEL
ncbi:MAG: DUF6512 family protein [Acutalibacteraceae bacterium]